jgi:hypothetical protein
LLVPEEVPLWVGFGRKQKKRMDGKKEDESMEERNSDGDRQTKRDGVSERRKCYTFLFEQCSCVPLGRTRVVMCTRESE